MTVKVILVDDPNYGETRIASSPREAFSASGGGDSSTLDEVKQLTGEPYAGNPPVRFEGESPKLSLYPLNLLHLQGMKV